MPFPAADRGAISAPKTARFRFPGVPSETAPFEFPCALPETAGVSERYAIPEQIALLNEEYADGSMRDNPFVKLHNAYCG